MIVLLTDYGLSGPYVGQLHAVIKQRTRDAGIIDLCHCLPEFNVRSAAYLLPAFTQGLPVGAVVVCVVDPGVGSDRQHALVEANGCYYIGPDNGLFDVLIQRVQDAVKYHFQWPDPASNTFHGRDVYAPVACMVHEAGNRSEIDCQPVKASSFQFAPDLDEITYIDEFGNAMTGLRSLQEHKIASLSVANQALQYATKFSDVAEGECFWYENAYGLVEIAANRSSAAAVLGLEIGDPVNIRYQAALC